MYKEKIGVSVILMFSDISKKSGVTEKVKTKLTVRRDSFSNKRKSTETP